MENENKFFIIEKEYFLGEARYSIYSKDLFDLTTATKKLLALDELNNNKDITYHLQKVDPYLDDSKNTVVMANGSHNIDTI
jgi:phage-related protein